MYRDGSNYKTFGTARFAGEITDDQRQKILGNLGGCDGDSFLPTVVGLPALHDQWESHYDDDHVWHEIIDIVVGSASPDQPLTVAEFAAEFAKATWDETEPLAQLEEWKASTRPGH